MLSTIGHSFGSRTRVVLSYHVSNYHIGSSYVSIVWSWFLVCVATVGLADGGRSLRMGPPMMYMASHYGAWTLPPSGRMIRSASSGASSSWRPLSSVSGALPEPHAPSRHRGVPSSLASVNCVLNLGPSAMYNVRHKAGGAPRHGGRFGQIEVVVPAVTIRAKTPPPLYSGPLYRSGAKVGQFRRPPSFGMPKDATDKRLDCRAQTAEPRLPTASSSRLISPHPDLSRCWRLESSFEHAVAERTSPYRKPYKLSNTSAPAKPLSRHNSAPIIVTSCSWALAANEALC